MTALITVAQAQACARAAMADTVQAVGGVGAAAIEAGVSEDTLRRWLRQSHGDWTLDAIIALSVAVLRQQGAMPLTHRLAQLIDTGAPAADPRRAMDDASNLLPLMLGQAQLIAQAMADRRITRDEARSLVHAIPELRRQLEQLETSAHALLRSER